MRPEESVLRVPVLISNPTARGEVVRISAKLPEGWELAGGAGVYEVPANTVVAIDGQLRPRAKDAAVAGAAIWEAVAGGSVVGSATIHVAVHSGLPQ